jgi:hypothetical protein
MTWRAGYCCKLALFYLIIGSISIPVGVWWSVLSISAVRIGIWSWWVVSWASHWGWSHKWWSIVALRWIARNIRILSWVVVNIFFNSLNWNIFCPSLITRLGFIVSHMLDLDVIFCCSFDRAIFDSSLWDIVDILSFYRLVFSPFMGSWSTQGSSWAVKWAIRICSWICECWGIRSIPRLIQYIFGRCLSWHVYLFSYLRVKLLFF